jgi:hypothetical protein
MIRLLAGEADCCWMISILVNQESNQHSMELTIPCENCHSNTSGVFICTIGEHNSYHLYHIGASFFPIL